MSACNSNSQISNHRCYAFQALFRAGRGSWGSVAKGRSRGRRLPRAAGTDRPRVPVPSEASAARSGLRERSLAPFLASFGNQRRVSRVSASSRAPGVFPLAAGAAGSPREAEGRAYLPGCSWPGGWEFGRASGRRLCAPGSPASPPDPSCPRRATGPRRQPRGPPAPSRPVPPGPVPSHLGGLLPSQSHLGGHDALPLHHQQAVGALAVAPAAEPLVSFQARHHAVVAAPGAFGSAAQLPRLSATRGRRRRLLAFLLLLFLLRAGCAARSAGGLGRLHLHALHVDLPVVGGASFSHGSSAAQLRERGQAARPPGGGTAARAEPARGAISRPLWSLPRTPRRPLPRQPAPGFPGSRARPPQAGSRLQRPGGAGGTTSGRCPGLRGRQLLAGTRFFQDPDGPPARRAPTAGTGALRTAGAGASDPAPPPTRPPAPRTYPSPAPEAVRAAREPPRNPAPRGAAAA